jgi:tRNA A-37 threonylcarbamoyl transferase component Bud32/tetratricopeptide (TPR) repeat protein
MTPDRFRQIQELFDAVQEGSAEERSGMLARADPDLRSEVESLLALMSEKLLLDRPVVKAITQWMDTESPTITDGTRLGPYRIDGKLGEGGMGKVFRAVDTRLGRAVAIKITHAHFSDRFEREARTISALNHSNICTLYDVGPNYLVMELVQGETLAVLLKDGPLTIQTVLLYGCHIAAALAEAHATGIIHRDLKPGNIMIGKSGVKVLDFGLARSDQDDTVTGSDMILGTPAYMAPEQREGKPADARTDIYSFGCVLYEMSTGARVVSQRRRLASRQLERIVSRCLEEDPERRWQSAAELERELFAVSAGTSRWGYMVPTAVAILALSGGAYLYLHHSPRLTDKDTLVLADFDNKTGDPVFDDTLRQGLSVELEQSPFLTLISDRRVQQTLGLMGQPKGARVTAEVAQQVCERTTSAAILQGSIASLGSQYVLSLRARNCNTGSILDQEQAQVARREDVLNSLSQIARKFRIRVGESLATVESHSTPLAEATTPSLEALKAYTTAVKAMSASKTAEAIPYFQRAVEIDPEFALAYAFLGFAYGGVGEPALSSDNDKRAWQLRDRASDRERFFIDFTYHRQVTGNLEKAFQSLELWAQTYPRESETDPRDLMGGLSAAGTGRLERAIEEAQKSIEANPDFAIGYINLARNDIHLDHFEEAGNALQQASARKLDIPDFLILRNILAFIRSDKEQMDRVAAMAKGKLSAEHQVANAQALVLARSGRLLEARQLSNRSVDLALQAGQREAAATYRAAAAVWQALYGNAAEARRSAMAALALSHSRDCSYAAALALALAGDRSRSEAVASDLDKRFPEDTFARFTYVPVLRAIPTLQQGKPTESLDELQTTLRYELAPNGLNFRFYLGGLHSAYVRGEAFVAARRYGEAASEFQKILDHRGITCADPIGTLAHLQLGRTFALSGDKFRAKTAYQDFLGLWKDADADIPILEQAKAEYARIE